MPQMNATHSGPAIVEQMFGTHVVVMCPRRHVITSARTSDFVNSHLEAKVGEHAARGNWIVTCSGS